jgi:hypothetical protein
MALRIHPGQADPAAAALVAARRDLDAFYQPAALMYRRQAGRWLANKEQIGKIAEDPGFRCGAAAPHIRLAFKVASDGGTLMPFRKLSREGRAAMTGPLGEPDRAAQVNSIYQALGRFLVEFSRVMMAMEGGLICAVGGEQRAARAIVAELTADPLAKAWRSATVETGELSDDEREVLKGLATQISTLIILRNDWAHGMWMVGQGNEESSDWSRALLWRFKNSAGGVAAPSKLERRPTAEYIEKAATHASVVAAAVHGVNEALAFRRIGSPAVSVADRVRITTEDGQQRVNATRDGGSTWQSSVWA